MKMPEVARPPNMSSNVWTNNVGPPLHFRAAPASSPSMTGSLGYAERLSWRDDLGGQLGDPELSEVDADLERKVDALADLVADAKAKGGAVVHTGAGISTSVGIPDFRGPNGIWTLQKEGKSMRGVVSLRPRASVLHPRRARRAPARGLRPPRQLQRGLPARAFRVPARGDGRAHGNCFAERCELCETEYVRDFECRASGSRPPAVASAGVRRRLGSRRSSPRPGARLGGPLTSRGIETRGTRIQGDCARARPRVESADHAELRLAPQDDEETTRRFRSRETRHRQPADDPEGSTRDAGGARQGGSRDVGVDATARRGGARVRAPRRVDRLARERERVEAAGRSFESEWTARGRGCPVPWLASARVEFHVVDEDGRFEPAKIKTCDGVGEGRRGF